LANPYRLLTQSDTTIIIAAVPPSAPFSPGRES